MKTKILILALLLVMITSVTKTTHATGTLVQDSGEGTTLGSLSYNETWDTNDFGYGEYDPYLLAGLTVNYQMVMGAITIGYPAGYQNDSSINVGAPASLNFSGGSDYSYIGSFSSGAYDQYLNMAYYCSYNAGSSGITAYLNWHI